MENQEQQAVEQDQVTTEQPTNNEPTNEQKSWLSNFIDKHIKQEQATKEPKTDIDALAEEKAKAIIEEKAEGILGKMAVTYKKEQKELLQQQEQELKATQLATEMRSKVDSEYLDFVNYQLQQTGQSLDEYLQANPKYQIKQAPVNTQLKNGINTQGVYKPKNEREAKNMQRLKDMGLF